MPELSEAQLEEVWQKVLNSTASQRRWEMQQEEKLTDSKSELDGDGFLNKQQKRREMRQRIENTPPANRPGPVHMRRVADEFAQRQRQERAEASDNAAAELVRKDPGFVPYDPRAQTIYSVEEDPRLVYVRPDNVPVGANVVGEAPPETKKRSWWSRGGGAATAVSNVALAAVVVFSAIIGSFQASV